MKHWYQCEICFWKHDNEKDALECEAQGVEEDIYPQGTIGACYLAWFYLSLPLSVLFLLGLLSFFAVWYIKEKWFLWLRL